MERLIGSDLPPLLPGRVRKISIFKVEKSKGRSTSTLTFFLIFFDFHFFSDFFRTLLPATKQFGTGTFEDRFELTLFNSDKSNKITEAIIGQTVTGYDLRLCSYSRAA